jgi:hypothetical protein
LIELIRTGYQVAHGKVAAFRKASKKPPKSRQKPARLFKSRQGDWNPIRIDASRKEIDILYFSGATNF